VGFYKYQKTLVILSISKLPTTSLLFPFSSLMKVFGKNHALVTLKFFSPKTGNWKQQTANSLFPRQLDRLCWLFLPVTSSCSC
jgi:hypothetical protein